MRVLLITDWPALEGGTERYVALLRAGLREAGDDARLLTSSVGTAADRTAEYVAYGSYRRSAQVALQVFNPSAARTLRAALREFRPHAVHLNMFLPHLSPAVLAPLRTVPTILAVLDYKPVCPIGTKLLPDGSHCSEPAGTVCWRGGCIGLPRLVREASRYGFFRARLRCIDRVQTASGWMHQELARAGIPAECVDFPVRMPDSGFLRRPSADPTFVYGGRLAPVKGVDVLLRAFARLHTKVPRARLRVVGDGPERRRLIRLATAIGLDEGVSFIRMSSGWVRELEPAWALVVPSVYREPLGFVAIEAIVHGVPVIATNGGGLAETVEPGVSGLLVPHGDEQRLAEGMQAIAERRAFPRQSVPPRTVEAMRRLHDPAEHVRRVRGLMASLQENRREAVPA
jgi:glycosyltransferase involved in cell wall biosynthesis